MDEDQIRQIAAIVAHEIGRTVPAEIPDEIGNAVAELGRASLWRFSVPLAGAFGLSISVNCLPTGCIELRLENWYGELVWQGTLRPPHPVTAQ